MLNYFAQPLFLAALAALAVPILLHLMNRELPRRIVFSSLRFILKGQQSQAGRKSLRELPLLLVRLGILTAVVLLFANPRRPLAATNTTSGRREELGLFVDLSMSMTAGDFPAFVRTESQRLLAQHPQAAVAIVAGAARADVALPLTADRKLVQDTLDALRPGLVPGRPAASLAALARLLSSGPEVQRVVYLLTDRQRTDWGDVKVRELLGDVDLHVVSPPRAGDGNLALVGVTPETFVQGTERLLRATVQVHNYAVAPATARLRLRAGEPAAEQMIQVPPEATSRFVLELKNPGANSGLAELVVDEAYTLDNAWHFWLGPRPAIRVAVMADTRAAGVALEVFFLRKALSTSLPGTDSIQVSLVNPAEATPEALRELGAVYLLDQFPNLDAGPLAALRDYVARGGYLLYFAGDRAADHLAMLNRERLLTTRFQGFSGELNQWQSTTVGKLPEEAGPLGLFAREPSDLLQFPVHRYVRLAPGAAARSLLEVAGGDPFLVHEDLGRGEVAAFAVGLAPSWSEFPTALSFLPLLRQLLEHRRTGQERGVLQWEVGTDLPAALAAAGLPADSPVEPRAQVLVIAGKPIELNLSRAESDLRPLETFELTGAPAPAAPGPGAEPSLTAASAPMRYYRTELAVALLALLLLELALANWRQG